MTVFILSLIAPIILYICLIQKFTNTNKIVLFFISSFILLSPFYRTSAYWGLEVNYAITTMLLSVYFFNIFKKKKLNNSNLYFLITLLTFTSSLCVYFDQKFLIIPLLVFIEIMKSDTKIKFKTYSIINFSFFSIPFIYLIFLLKGIVPPSTQYANPNTITSISRLNLLWFEHLGYATTMIAFYFLPVIFLKKDNLLLSAKKDFLDKKNNLFLALFLIYLIYFFTFVNFEELTKVKYLMGLGFIHKISLIFLRYFLQEIFTCLSFLISWIIILFFLEKNLSNFLILFYFYFLSVILWPLMQEYFDPIIFLFALIIFSSKLLINYKNSMFTFLYLSIFLICANFYY